MATTTDVMRVEDQILISVKHQFDKPWYRGLAQDI
jgi:hypothetical protein